MQKWPKTPPEFPNDPPPCNAHPDFRICAFIDPCINKDLFDRCDFGAPMMGVSLAGFGPVTLPSLGAGWLPLDPLRQFIREGMFAGSERPDSIKGKALVVDLQNGGLKDAVVGVVLERIKAIRSADSDGPLFVELVVEGDAADVAARAESLTLAFRQLAADSNLSVTVTPRSNNDALRARLAELGETNTLNVVAPSGAENFWFGFRVSLRMLTVRLLVDLVNNVEVDVVYYGAEADAVAQFPGAHREDGGRVRFRGLPTPMQQLLGDTQKIEIFNQQA